MKTEQYIANRISKIKTSKGQYSKIINRLSTIAISASLSIIILAICFGTGLKKSIENNFIELFSNIRIENFTNNNDIYSEGDTFSLNQEKIEKIKNLKHINHVQPVLNKFTALSFGDNLNGAIFLGIDSSYNINYIKEKLIEGDTDLRWEKGKLPKVIISSKIAKNLEVYINDTILSSFARIKKNINNYDTTATFSNCVISGIYETDIKEYDKKICFVNMDYLRDKFKLNNESISYYEVFIDGNLNSPKKKIETIINSPLIKVSTLSVKFPWIYQWLNIFNKNIYYITIIMLCICFINMLSFLIILVLERTKMIGILKSFGTKNKQIAKIFFYISIKITIKGILYGNTIALIIFYIQNKFEIIKLNPESYFVKTLPIVYPLEKIIQINIISLIFIQIALIIPFLIITKLKPSKILYLK